MRNDMGEIAGRVRALLDARGEGERDLARLLELPEDEASNLLDGNRGLAAQELTLLCGHFNVSSDYILFGETEGEVGVLLRGDGGIDTKALVARVEKAFDDLRYVRALAGV